MYDLIRNELLSYSDNKKGDFLPKFFKSFEGGYGYGDKFIGVTVPNQRLTAKKYFKEISLADTEKLLQENIHEYRLTALLILVYKYQKLKDEPEKQEIVDLYLRNTDYINNWDLVDSSAYNILGPYLIDKDKSLLYEFALADDLWKQRIAIITTFHFIRNKQFTDTIKISELLLNHKHDLIHKAVGWMLREMGNRDFETEYSFLKKHYKQMPRTMLRYAIEKFDEELRQRFLKGLV